MAARPVFRPGRDGLPDGEPGRNATPLGADAVDGIVAALRKFAPAPRNVAKVPASQA